MDWSLFNKMISSPNKTLNEDILPNYWWLLTSSDLQQYNYLRYALSSTESKNQRNRRIATFSEAIEAVRLFVIRGDINDSIRALVCGIAWLPEGLDRKSVV